MKIIAFPHSATYPRGSHNVYVRLRLPGAKVPTVITALMDTGAAVTLLNRNYAKYVGIENISSGEKIEFISATKQKVIAFIHPVRVEFMAKPMTIDVAFAPDVETPDLLGMRSFFEQITVAFSHKERRFDFAFV